MNKNKIEQAKEFAHQAHDSVGQKRKYTNLPYWTHTDMVAEIVASVVFDDEDVIAAAHLHDVIEDVYSGLPPFHDNSPFTPWGILNRFGRRVHDLVVDLTDVYTKVHYPHLNRAQRKELERNRLGSVSPAAKTIKVADLIHNSNDIVIHDLNFARVYLGEKAALLPFLLGGNPTLWAIANQQVRQFEEIAKIKLTEAQKSVG